MIQPSLLSLKDFYATGATKSYDYRIAHLKKLKSTILQYESEILSALYTDLKKSPEEAWATEIGLVMVEINTAIRGLKNWMRPQKVKTNLINYPSSSKIIYEQFIFIVYNL